MPPIYNDSLTMTLSGKHQYLAASSFLRVARDTLLILKEIERDIASGEEGSITWRVLEVSMNSPLKLTVYGDPPVVDADHSQEIVTSFIDGLRQIDRNPVAPPHFSVRSLEIAKGMVGLLADGLAWVEFSSPGKRDVSPTPRVIRNVDSILKDKPKYRHENATIEGRLEILSVHGRPQFKVFGSQSKKGITCRFQEHNLATAQKAFGKRVVISGRVKYDQLGKPIAVAADDIRILKDRDHLPTYRDLRGIDITGGIDPTEYVRRMRDAE